MKMSHFDDTDTLCIEFKDTDVSDSKDLDENTILDVDVNGDIVAITIEYASIRTDIQNRTLSGIVS